MSLPEPVVEEAARLTRLARRSGDGEDVRARRDRLLARYGYRARVRVEERGRRSSGPDRGADRSARDPRTGERLVLVCYPDEWVANGTVDPGRIEDVSRAIERPLSGPEDETWSAVETHNRSVAERIADEHGSVHGANAHAFADFMGNHYAARADRATDAHVTEFLEEYLPRNAWPTDEQLAEAPRSVELVREHEDQ